MNRGELVVRASQTLGAAGSGADSAEELLMLDDLIYEAIVDISMRTRVNICGLTINLQAGEQEYDLGATVLRLFDVKKGTTPLYEVAPADINNDGGAYTFTVLGFNRIMLGASPSTGDTLKAWYTPLPTKMSSDAHDPATDPFGEIPVPFHPAILNYVCWKGADIIGDQGSGRGEKYRIYYEGQDGMAGLGSNLGTIKMAINQRGGSGANRRTVRRIEDRSVGDADPSYWTS